MPQLRLTDTFFIPYADKLNHLMPNDPPLTTLAHPVITTALFDDWVYDLIDVAGEPTAFIMHAKTLLAFLIPLSYVGGIEYVPLHVSEVLEVFLESEERWDCKEEMINTVRNTPPIFCTIDQPDLVTKMDRLVEFVHLETQHKCYEDVDFDVLIKALHEFPMQLRDIGDTTPLDMMRHLLSASSRSGAH